MPSAPVLAVAALLLELSASLPLQRADSAGAGTATQSFDDAVTAYMTLRSEAVKGLPPPQLSLSTEEIRANTEIRRQAIARSRATARQGDLFSKEASRVFRARIREILRQHGFNDVQALAIIDEEAPLGPVPMIVVNGHFPWDYGYTMLSSVLEVLPALPRGLQYRFVHNSLVLLDVDADLIVDILPNAIAHGIYA